MIKNIKIQFGEINANFHEVREDIKDIGDCQVKLNAYRPTLPTVAHPEIEKESRLHPQLQYN